MTDPAIPPRHPRGEERTITLVRGDVQSFARIVWGTTGDRRYFVALDGPTGHLEATDRDYFEALARIREQLEPAGWLVALQGARRQTFPSGMLRDTAGARRVYVLEPGRPVRRDDAVRTFDPADPQDLATVAEQEDFYRQWRESVRNTATRPAAQEMTLIALRLADRQSAIATFARHHPSIDPTGTEFCEGTFQAAQELIPVLFAATVVGNRGVVPYPDIFFEGMNHPGPIVKAVLAFADAARLALRRPSTSGPMDDTTEGPTR